MHEMAVYFATFKVLVSRFSLDDDESEDEGDAIYFLNSQKFKAETRLKVKITCKRRPNGKVRV